MTFTAHFLGFTLVTFMWTGIYFALKDISRIDFTKLPHPNEEWRGKMIWLTLVGLSFVLLAYR